MSTIQLTSAAFFGAYQKGRRAYRVDRRSKNPYPDWTTDYHSGVTFSRAFRGFWNEGFHDEARERPDRYAVRPRKPKVAA